MSTGDETMKVKLADKVSYKIRSRKAVIVWDRRYTQNRKLRKDAQ